MQRGRFRAGVAALLWLMAASALRAEDQAGAASSGKVPSDCAREVSERIQRRYESVRDLAARFEQTSEVAALGPAARQVERSRGEVVFAKPGKMRWSYKEPSPSIVVSDGRLLWIYDAAAREAQRFEGSEGFLSGAAVQFLLGEGSLLRDFHVTARDCGADTSLLELVPREPAAYEKLEVRSDTRSGEIRETAVFDLVGNVTRVHFEDIRVNQTPSPQTFQFEPPAGVRVLEVPAVQP